MAAYRLVRVVLGDCTACGKRSPSHTLTINNDPLSFTGGVGTLLDEAPYFFFTILGFFAKIYHLRWALWSSLMSFRSNLKWLNRFRPSSKIAVEAALAIDYILH